MADSSSPPPGEALPPNILGKELIIYDPPVICSVGYLWLVLDQNDFFALHSHRVGQLTSYFSWPIPKLRIVCKTKPLRKLFQTASESTARRVWKELVVGQWTPLLKAGGLALTTEAFPSSLAQLVKQAALPRDFEGMVRSWVTVTDEGLSESTLKRNEAELFSPATSNQTESTKLASLRKSREYSGEFLAEVLEDIKRDKFGVAIAFEEEYTLPLDEIKQIYKSVLCPLCGRPAKNPTTLLSEPHSIFCSSCLVRSGVPHDEVTLQEAPATIQSALGNIAVICPFHKEDCEWTGTRNQLQSHVSSCKFVVYHCSYAHNGCDFSTKQVDAILQHMLACPHKIRPHDSVVQSENARSQQVAQQALRFQMATDSSEIQHSLGEFSKLGLASIVSILHHCDVESVLSFGSASKSCWSISRENAVWQPIARVLFPLAPFPQSSPVHIDWLALLKETFMQTCLTCGQKHSVRSQLSQPIPPTDAAKEPSKSQDTHLRPMYHPGTYHDLAWLQFLTRNRHSLSDNFRDISHLAKKPLTYLVSDTTTWAYVIYAAGMFIVYVLGETNPMLKHAISLVSYLVMRGLQLPTGAGKKIEEAKTEVKRQVLRWTCCGALGAFAKPCTQCPTALQLQFHSESNQDSHK